MANKPISSSKIKKILEFYAIQGVNKTQISRALDISRETVYKYINLYENSDLQYLDLYLLKGKQISTAIKAKPPMSSKLENLLQQFPLFHQEYIKGRATLKELWLNYYRDNPSGYKYSRFAFHYQNWRKANNLDDNPNKWNLNINKADQRILKEWHKSTDRNKWEKAVALLELNEGQNMSDICIKVERSRKTIKKWIHAYSENGLENIDLRRTREVPDSVKENIKIKTNRIIKLLHEPPSLYNINRTSWSLKTLSYAYEDTYGDSISCSSISEYLHSQGFSFKKARVVLTSPDPDYREKLNRIKTILSGLKETEKFFSIDEFGPASIKIRGGRTYTPKDQLNTVPQFQVSKGSLICTAALELSTNQITHFYSKRKNTKEMIRLLNTLLKKYSDEEKIYLSWDAASWHASKELYEEVDRLNDSEYRQKNHTPIVNLAPLPSSAQFLNVIESVFSGMAKAIIHNSNYQSVDECKIAIDTYFAERNEHFLKHPKRAGNKIWRKEIVIPQFSESNNCKDPNYR